METKPRHLSPPLVGWRACLPGWQVCLTNSQGLCYTLGMPLLSVSCYQAMESQSRSQWQKEVTCLQSATQVEMARFSGKEERNAGTRMSLSPPQARCSPSWECLQLMATRCKVCPPPGKPTRQMGWLKGGIVSILTLGLRSLKGLLLCLVLFRKSFPILV